MNNIDGIELNDYSSQGLMSFDMYVNDMNELSQRSVTIINNQKREIDNLTRLIASMVHQNGDRLVVDMALIAEPFILEFYDDKKKMRRVFKTRRIDYTESEK